MESRKDWLNGAWSRHLEMKMFSCFVVDTIERTKRNVVNFIFDVFRFISQTTKLFPVFVYPLPFPSVNDGSMDPPTYLLLMAGEALKQTRTENDESNGRIS